MKMRMGNLDFATNSLSNNFQIKGIFSIKGVLFDTTLIEPSEVIPVLFFHGTDDTYYPFLTGYAFSCPNYFVLQGSGEIVKRLNNLGTCYELNFKNKIGHELQISNYVLLREAEFFNRVLHNNCKQIIIEDYNCTKCKKIKRNRKN